MRSSEFTGAFHQLEYNPEQSTTGPEDILLKEIEAKTDQFDPDAVNVCWIVSRSTFCLHRHVQKVAWFYRDGRGLLEGDPSCNHSDDNCAHPGLAHQKPQHLSGLGWMWDRAPGYIFGGNPLWPDGPEVLSFFELQDVPWVIKEIYGVLVQV